MFSAFRRQKVATLFADLDVNGDGQIARNDIDLLIDNHAEAFGYEPATAEYEDLVHRTWEFWDQVRQFDADGDGAVSLDEYLAGFDTFLEQREAFMVSLNQLTDLLFAMFDRDGDGLIGEEDLVLHFRAWHRPEAKGREAFPRLDRTQRGGISKADWVQAFDEFFYSEDPEAPGNWLAPTG